MKTFKTHGYGDFLYVNVRKCVDGLVLFSDTTTLKYDRKGTPLSTLTIYELSARSRFPVETIEMFFNICKSKSIIFRLCDERSERDFVEAYKKSGRNPEKDYVLSDKIISLSKISVLEPKIKTIYLSSLFSATHSLPLLVKVDYIAVPWWQINKLSLKVWKRILGVGVISFGRTKRKMKQYIHGDIDL